MEFGLCADDDEMLLPGFAGADRKQDKEWRRDLARLLGLAAACLLGIAFFTYFFVLARLPPDEWAHLRSPTSFSNVQELGQSLKRYAEQHSGRLMVGHAAIYLFLQTFAVPGTIFANLLGGALFGMWRGLPLCILCSSVGSCACFYVYGTLGARPLQKLAAGKLRQLRSAVDKHRGDMLAYLTFLFVFPFTPHWLMKAAAPHLRVPMAVFLPAVSVGLIPYNFLSCKAGLVLSELSSQSDVWDTRSTVWLVIISILGLAGPWLAKRFVRGGRGSRAGAGIVGADGKGLGGFSGGLGGGLGDLWKGWSGRSNKKAW